MRSWHLIRICVIAACWASAVRGDEPGDKNYVVFPVKTDLQRALHTMPTTSTIDPVLQIDNCFPDVVLSLLQEGQQGPPCLHRYAFAVHDAWLGLLLD